LIISKTPYRISFFGGGTDYPIWYKKFGGEVISTSINKYIYLSVRDLPPFFKHKYRIVYSKTEIANNLKSIKFKVVRKILEEFKINKSLEIHYDGDLPARSGMGSSSSFVVGLVNIFNTYNKKHLNPKKLSLQSLNFEHNIMNEIVGSQDQIAASHGGFNSIKFPKNGNYKLENFNLNQDYFKKLNDNLVLVYTGINRTARVVAKSYIDKLNNVKKKELFEILNLTQIAKKIISNKQLDEFGLLLDETWKLKKSISKTISNPKIDYIYENGIKQGAIGGKLLGAGSGGFILFYVPKDKKKNFFKNFKDIIKINFKFEKEGSKIIHNSYE
jgi:D-glycero-alpha-D-manno-heptose-7-phosphate kinase